jgi:hypothetical protein
LAIPQEPSYILDNCRSSSDIDVVIPIFDIAANFLAFSAIAPEVVGSFITPPLSADIEHVSRYLAEFLAGPAVPQDITFRQLNDIARALLFITRDGKVIPNPTDEFQVLSGDSFLAMAPSRETIEKFRDTLMI